MRLSKESPFNTKYTCENTFILKYQTPLHHIVSPLVWRKCKVECVVCGCSCKLCLLLTLHLGTNTVVTLLVELNASSLYFQVYDCSSLSYIYNVCPRRNIGQTSSAIHLIKVLDKCYNFVISNSSIAASPGIMVYYRAE